MKTLADLKPGDTLYHLRGETLRALEIAHVDKRPSGGLVFHLVHGIFRKVEVSAKVLEEKKTTVRNPSSDDYYFSEPEAYRAILLEYHKKKLQEFENEYNREHDARIREIKTLSSENYLNFNHYRFIRQAFPPNGVMQ